MRELTAMLEHVTANGYSRNKHGGFDKGLLAALRWAAGQTDTPPVSDTPLGRPVTGSDAKREQYQEHEAMSGLAEPKLRAVRPGEGPHLRHSGGEHPGVGRWRG